MVLALLEQMEVLAVRKPLLVFMVLDVLKKGEVANVQVTGMCVGQVFSH